LTLLLGLPLALASQHHPTCAPLVPVTFDNATVPRLLGRWIYICGASKFPPHVAEMKVIKHAAFAIYPSGHEDELNVTEILRVNETCVEKNASKIQVLRDNSTLVHVEDHITSVAKLIQSNEDLLILQHTNNNFPGLSLSARTANVSKEHLEEFKAHLHCLGFTEEEIFFTS
ncbi:A1AG protein, partial [Rhinopomastus cyanomelas]|nr:A1AG protein [Rhinopomastus cyanomelas]